MAWEGGGLKRTGAGKEGNESAWGTLGRAKKRRAPSHRPPRAPDFSTFPVFPFFSPFSHRFPTEGAFAEERAINR